MYVVKLFNEKDEILNAHALTDEPTKVQIASLISIFSAEYAVVDERHYKEELEKVEEIPEPEAPNDQPEPIQEVNTNEPTI